MILHDQSTQNSAVVCDSEPYFPVYLSMMHLLSAMY